MRTIQFCLRMWKVHIVTDDSLAASVLLQNETQPVIELSDDHHLSNSGFHYSNVKYKYCIYFS